MYRSMCSSVRLGHIEAFLWSLISLLRHLKLFRLIGHVEVGCHSQLDVYLRLAPIMKSYITYWLLIDSQVECELVCILDATRDWKFPNYLVVCLVGFSIQVYTIVAINWGLVQCVYSWSCLLKTLNLNHMLWYSRNTQTLFFAFDTCVNDLTLCSCGPQTSMLQYHIEVSQMFFVVPTLCSDARLGVEAFSTM